MYYQKRIFSLIKCCNFFFLITQRLVPDILDILEKGHLLSLSPRHPNNILNANSSTTFKAKLSRSVYPPSPVSVVCYPRRSSRVIFRINAKRFQRNFPKLQIEIFNLKFSLLNIFYTKPGAIEYIGV